MERKMRKSMISTVTREDEKHSKPKVSHSTLGSDYEGRAT